MSGLLFRLANQQSTTICTAHKRWKDVAKRCVLRAENASKCVCAGAPPLAPPLPYWGSSEHSPTPLSCIRGERKQWEGKGNGGEGKREGARKSPILSINSGCGLATARSRLISSAPSVTCQKLLCTGRVLLLRHSIAILIGVESDQSTACCFVTCVHLYITGLDLGPVHVVAHKILHYPQKLPDLFRQYINKNKWWHSCT